MGKRTFCKMYELPTVKSVIEENQSIIKITRKLRVNPSVIYNGLKDMKIKVNVHFQEELLYLNDNIK